MTLGRGWAKFFSGGVYFDLSVIRQGPPFKILFIYVQQFFAYHN